MHQWQITYQAPSSTSAPIIERGVIRNDITTPEKVAAWLQSNGGFWNPLSGKFVFVSAVMEVAEVV